MKKILQKSLASMVSAALCLTAFVSCLTVSATRGTGAFTVESPSAKPGESVTVPVVITSNDDSEGIAAAIFDLTFNTNVLTPTAVAAPSTELDYGADYRSNDGVGIYVDVDAETGLGTMRVLAFLKDSKAAPVPEMTANITFTVAAEAAVGDTPITLTNAQACDYGTADSNGIYASDEDFIDMTIVNGAVTVTSAHTHTWEFVSGTPATGSDNSSNVEYTKGSITLRCADCGSENTEVVNYSYYSRAQDSGVEYGSETLLRFGTRYETDHPRIATNANITDGYIVLTQKRLDTTVATVATQMKKCDSGVNVNGQKIYQTKIGIVGFAMSDDVTSTFYAYDSTSGAWYSGFQMTYSVKSAAENILASSTNDTQKTALVNLLNYGASAQEYFAQKTEYSELNNVVRSNAGIDAYQSFATTPRAFDGPAMNFNYQDDGSFVFCFYKSNLLVDSKTTNRIFFRIPGSYSGASTAVDMTGYTVEVTYTDFSGNLQTEVYTADQFKPEGRVNRFYIEVPFTTPDLRQVVTFVVKNPDGVAAGPSSTVSVENIANDIISTTTDSFQSKMINCLMAFSDAAFDYLTTKN